MKTSENPGTALSTHELTRETAKRKNQLTIGIPREQLDKERRLALTPEAVDMIVEFGHQVLLESGAGVGISYDDVRYAESGARIVSKEEAFGCDIVFKIAPPTPEEVGLMKDKAMVCSMLQFTDLSGETIKKMMAKRMNAVGYELLSSDGKCFPVRNSISEIEGATAISVASELLSNAHGGKGVLMGGVPGVSPTEVVILGAGVAGTVATRAALGLGAIVKVFDSEISKLRDIQNAVGSTLFTSVFHPNVLVNAFKSADVIIGAMRYPNSAVRHVISEDMVRSMKEGALIIDLRVNHGGCFETTCMLPEGTPVLFKKHNVLHYCAPNLSSRVSRTTSMALSNIFVPLITQLQMQGGCWEIGKLDVNFCSGLYLYAGKVVNAHIASRYNLQLNDLGLYLSAY